jgi:hypothetical protein
MGANVSEDERLDVGDLVESGLSARINLIFDVDHTLILAIDKNLTRIMPG